MEIWKDVEGFEGYYQVSNLGRVKSVAREKCGECGRRGKAQTFLKSAINKRSGYCAVSMSKPGMGRHKVVVWLIHRLVATHFIEGRTKEKRVVNHKDFVRHNNRAENLEWMSYSENVQHAYDGGRFPVFKRFNRHAKSAVSHAS
jgi:hypothetical protein